METVNVSLFGQDPKVQKAVSTAKNVSVTKAPVLISGEAGVGKRTLASFIHQNSNRETGPLEFVDCSGDSVEVENKILGTEMRRQALLTKVCLKEQMEELLFFAMSMDLVKRFKKDFMEFFLS